MLSANVSSKDLMNTKSKLTTLNKLSKKRSGNFTWVQFVNSRIGSNYTSRRRIPDYEIHAATTIFTSAAIHPPSITQNGAENTCDLL